MDGVQPDPDRCRPNDRWSVTCTDTATVLTKNFDGTDSVTDGPYAETKEQLGRLLPGELRQPGRCDCDRPQGADPCGAEDIARAAGFREIRLYTNEAMTANTTYYEHRGYVETHRSTEAGYNRINYTREVS
ncbi:hypothetical protein GQR58_030647 [Nymphon striatum]|nr:hypothetical protein GQR58_030647 [Nymphon striatum]